MAQCDGCDERENEVERLEAELADIRDCERTILEEKCASDEIHCGCVPTLRKEIARLTRGRDMICAEFEDAHTRIGEPERKCDAFGRMA